MLPVARKNKIKEIITEQKSVIVADLAITFKVTEETIRRDLKALEDEGVLTRTYGGAFVQDGVMNNINISIRETIMVDSKETIASLCRRRIHNGDSIYIDPSTTSLFIAQQVKDMRLTVLSNSLKVLDSLMACQDINLMGIGGSFSAKHMSFVGRGALNALKDYYVDKAFISCRSLDMGHGVTDSSESLAEIRRAVLQQANEVYLVADHSKFDKISFLRICEMSEISHIVTDRHPSVEWQTFCADNNIELINPSEN